MKLDQLIHMAMGNILGNILHDWENGSYILLFYQTPTIDYKTIMTSAWFFYF